MSLGEVKFRPLVANFCLWVLYFMSLRVFIFGSGFRIWDLGSLLRVLVFSFWPLEVNNRQLAVDVVSLKVNFRPLKIEFWPLRVDTQL